MHPVTKLYEKLDKKIGKPIIAVDFDGTLVEHCFPEIGPTNEKVLNFVLKMQDKGANIILWTCREGEKLKEAVDWCKEKGIKLAAVNENIPELKGADFGHRKIYADVYLDDRNISIDEVD